MLVSLLRSAGCASVDGPVVVPDGEPVEAALHQAVAEGYDVVVTTGGTGLTPTDLHSRDDPSRARHRDPGNRGGDPQGGC